MDKYSKRRLETMVKALDDAAREYTRGLQEDDGDRRNVIWCSKMKEVKNTFSVYINEAGNILEQIAESEVHLSSLQPKIKRRIKSFLEAENLELREPMWVECKGSPAKMCISIKTRASGATTTKSVADILSIACDVRLVSDVCNPYYVSGDLKEYSFYQEPQYRFYTGCAGAVRENEKVSGDNYQVFEPEAGKVIVGLSDGMGSGNTAGKDSEYVLEEIEKLCSFGYSKEAAVRIAAGLLVASDEHNPATIDLCEIDLYKGEYSLVKAGASSTYIVNRGEVFCMKSKTLPVGIDYPTNMETGRGKFTDGTYIVMLTDGVTEALNTDEEDMIEELLQDIKLEQPGEIAGYLLNRAIIAKGGRINDDMMILVTGLWRND